MTQNLKPIFNNLKQKWEKREEIREQVLHTMKLAGGLLEAKAKEVAVQAKDSPLVTNYVRPVVSSARTEEVLTRLQARLNNPLVNRLEDLRRQFLEATEPVTKEAAPLETVSEAEVVASQEEEAADVGAPKKRRSTKKTTQQDA